MRTLGLLIALCVAGCQFSVEGLGGGVSSGPQQQGPAVDFSTGTAADAGSAADLAPEPDLARLPPPPPPPPPPPMDCRTSGCPMDQICVAHGDKFDCQKPD